MKTIVVSNGDIQLNHGKIQFSTGSDKLIQDLNRWLVEPLGTGYTTPGFGSLLPSYIGTAQDGSSVGTIENEILRILQLYQGQQVLSLRASQNSAQLANWNKSEIIQSIVSIQTVIQNTQVISSVVLKTFTGDVLSINISVTNNGVTVNNG